MDCLEQPTKNTHKRRQRGFSMIEIMVAVLILGVLLGIVLPVVQGYVERARRAEAVAMIGEMQSRLDGWRAENPTYAVADGDADFGPFPGGDYYDISLSDGSATGYVLTATGKGKQASDPECSEYVLERADGVETRTPDPATSRCW